MGSTARLQALVTIMRRLSERIDRMSWSSVNLTGLVKQSGEACSSTGYLRVG